MKIAKNPTSQPVISQSSVLSPQSLILLLLPLLLAGWLVASLLFSPLQTSQTKGNDFISLGSGTVIQSFQGEYSNLSKIYVKYSGNLLANSSDNNLEVRLHRDTASGPIVAQWSGKEALASDGLSFAAQPNSRGQTYFLKFSSRTPPAGADLQLQYSKNEVYPAGQLLIGERPAQGDLYFVAEYSPDPGEMLDSFFGKQQRFGGAPGLAIFFFLAGLVIAEIMIWCLVKNERNLLRSVANGERKTWLIFGGLVLALRLALSLTFMLTDPLLQGPDEPGHIGHTLHFAEGKPDSAFTTPVADLMQRTRFVENFPWLSYADNPVELYPPNAEQLQLPFYYWIGAGLVKIGDLFGADFSAENYLARLNSVLMGLITVGPALALGYVWRKESVGLALTLPLSTALLPEAIHLSGVTNNDNGAIAFGAIAAWGMALLFMRGPRLPYFAIVGAGLVLAIFSKASANGLLAGYAIGFYMLAWIYWRARWQRLALIGLPVVLALLGLAVVFALTDHDRAATAWYNTPTSQVGRHAERSRIEGAHSGQYMIKLGPQDKPVEQQINLFNRGDFTRVRVSGWLRRADETNNNPKAIVRLETVKETLTEQSFPVSGTDWKAFSFEADANAFEISHTRIKAFLRLQISNSGDAIFYLDDLKVAPVNDPEANLLANPSFEQSVWTWKSDWAGAGRGARSFAADILDAAQNGASLDYGNIFLQNTIFIFITFWGAFGWSQVLFDTWVYLLGGIIFLLAIVGLFRSKAWNFSRGGRAFILFCLLCTVMTDLALQFIRLPTSWMYESTPDIIHSRHAFAALLPQLLLLVAGLRGLQGFRLLPRRGRVDSKAPRNDIIPSKPAETVQPEDFETSKTTNQTLIWVWVWGVFLFWLSMLALVNTIFPFYYNS
jgi:hypothetical protein